MIRLGAACVFFTLCACGKERPDPRLAELTTPAHITVRLIDGPLEKTCEGSTTERLKCIFSRAERRGCVYVEVGAAAETPQLSKAPDMMRCNLIEASSKDRALLSGQPGRKANVTVDPSGGDRVVIEVSDGVHVIYLRDGHLAVHTRFGDVTSSRASILLNPDGTVNWARVPPFLAMVDETQLLALTEPELDALLAATPDGKSFLKDALMARLNSINLTDASFTRALSKLDAPDRAEFRARLLQQVSGGSDGALQWFDAHPEEQGPEFIDSLAEAVENETVDLSTALPRLLRLDPRRAEELACDLLERRWHEGATAEYSYDSTPEAAALAVLITRRSKCPWVLPLLLSNPCAAALRCDPDPDDKKPMPLCSEAETDKVLQRVLHPEIELTDEESMVSGEDWGPLLVAAVRVQGPLPVEFLRAEERRLYAQTFTRADAPNDDVCRELTMEPADWACRLPRAISTAFNEGCTMVIDDVKKTLTLSSPEPEPEPDLRE